MKKFALFLILGLLVTVSPSVTTPIDAIGTTLPSLSTSLNYRVFNDLMKQSLPIVPYQFIWGGIGRYWGYNLSFINGQNHQYPASLPVNVYAVAEIQFYPEDEALVNQTFNLKFQGAGVVGVYQQGLFNLTWGSATGGNFTLKAVNQSLFVYIYLTSVTNPVNSITILSTALPDNPSTFTINFLNYVAPFNLLRTCFWQGQNVYSSGKASQIWANRTILSSSTQISPNGVALEHILEL